MLKPYNGNVILYLHKGKSSCSLSPNTGRKGVNPMKKNLNNRTYNRARVMKSAWNWAHNMARKRNDRRFLNTRCAFWKLALSFAHENERKRISIVRDFPHTTLETWYGWKLAGYTVKHGETATVKLPLMTNRGNGWNLMSTAFFTIEQVEISAD